MMRLSLLAALALGACSQMADMSHDLHGNTYPSDCPATLVSDPGLLSLIDIQRRHVAGTLGTAARGLGGRFTVTLNPTLSGDALEDTRRHEFCHVKHWIATGNPHWHALHVPNVYRAPSCPNPFHC